MYEQYFCGMTTIVKWSVSFTQMFGTLFLFTGSENSTKSVTDACDDEPKLSRNDEGAQPNGRGKNRN